MRDLDGGDGAFKYGIDAQAGHPSDKGAVAYMVYEIRYAVHMETSCHDRRRWIRRAQPRFS